MSHDAPEVVYLVTSRTEWPVSSYIGDPDSAAAWADREVERRRRSGNHVNRSELKVWRARLTDVEELELMPETVVRASLRPRCDGDPR